MQIEHNPSSRQLIVFGLLWFLVLGAGGSLAWMKSGAALRAAVLIALAVLVPGLGILWTEFIRKIYVWASYATYPIGATVSFIVLAVMYYGVVTPVGLALRLAGYDPLMRRRPAEDRETFWISRKSKKEIADYFQQF